MRSVRCFRFCLLRVWACFRRISCRSVFSIVSRLSRCSKVVCRIWWMVRRLSWVHNRVSNWCTLCNASSGIMDSHLTHKPFKTWQNCERLRLLNDNSSYPLRVSFDRCVLVVCLLFEQQAKEVRSKYGGNIESYSECLNQVRHGKNKDNDRLPQINLMPSPRYEWTHVFGLTDFAPINTLF